jgi:predicted RNase H-like HicB family nuclease
VPLKEKVGSSNGGLTQMQKTELPTGRQRVTVTEAAQIFGCSEDAVRRRLHRGELKGIRDPAGSRRWLIEVPVDAFPSAAKGHQEAAYLEPTARYRAVTEWRDLLPELKGQLDEVRQETRSLHEQVDMLIRETRALHLSLQSTATASLDRHSKVDDYVKLAYHVDVSRDNDHWVAVLPELPGLAAVADTWAELEREIEVAKRVWIETQLDLGCSIPVPRGPGQYSEERRAKTKFAAEDGSPHLDAASWSALMAEILDDGEMSLAQDDSDCMKALARLLFVRRQLPLDESELRAAEEYAEAALYWNTRGWQIERRGRSRADLAQSIPSYG